MERELRDEVASLRREVRDLESTLLTTRKLETVVRELVTSLPSPKPIQIPRADKSTSKIGMGLGLTDWHSGLVVRPDEVQGYEEYDWVIARRRLKQMVSKLVTWVTLQRQHYRIDRLNVIGLGDLCNGMIHLENLMFDEFAPPEQAINAGYALGEVLVALSAVFPEVVYDGTDSDNHARLMKKTQYQHRGQWSFNPVLHAIAREVVSKCKNVEFNEHHEIKMEIPIHDKLFLAEHGNDVRAWMGIPHYGLTRMKHREADRRSRTRKDPADYYICGHWHSYGILENQMLCPSLCGTTPYDHAAGRYSDPGQVCWMVGSQGWFGHLKMDLR